MSSRRVAAVQTRESGDQGAGLGELDALRQVLGIESKDFAPGLDVGSRGMEELKMTSHEASPLL